MKPKNILTITLLLFLATSIVVLAVKSLRREAGQAEGKPLSDGVIAYYFHGNTRCPTCRRIESYAREAVQNGFARQIEDGSLRWRMINYEQSGNEHFATEYGVAAPTVVLVKMENGRQKQWENLGRVWELVGDKAAFVDYVGHETRALLEGTTN